MIESVKESLEFLEKLNPRHFEGVVKSPHRNYKLQKVLIANRGEIAKRFFLALKEENIPSVAVVTEADLGQSWYQHADEVIVIGDNKNYTNIPVIIAAAFMVGANAIYPGYGFLSENPDFVEAIELTSKEYQKELIFMGPSAQVMQRVGDKLAARKLAQEEGVPLFEGSKAIADDPQWQEAKLAAQKIGYPVIVKLSAGGGGKGMVPVFEEAALTAAIEYCKRIGKNLYNDERFYLEKFIEQPVHMEVQIFNGTAIGIRKCAAQRKNQKVIEETGDFFLDAQMILAILSAAENMARISGYDKGAGAGTVEFLYDPKLRRFGFLEMNTRLQVEHPVTDQSLGIDLATWQILQFDERKNEIPIERALEGRFGRKQHAIEARIYAEDPENEYAPSPGKIHELDLPTFLGLRCDFGFKKGDVILPHYDPMIGKIIAFGDTREEAISRLKRSLSELYIQGVTTNVNQLLQVVRHEQFLNGEYTNLLLSEFAEFEHPNPDSHLTQQAAIFGALCDHSRTVGETVQAAFASHDLENTVENMRINNLPTTYKVKVYKHNYKVELLQISLESFYVFINEQYVGEVELMERSEGDHDYLIRYGLQFYPVRVDHRPAFSILRVTDDSGFNHYLKMNISRLDNNDDQDPTGMQRSPFHAAFVSFANDAQGKSLVLGSRVEKDDAVVIISAMKMETVLKAPISGRISFLAEEGDLSRLQIGKTADGLVIGKNISEGEVLFIIEAEESQEELEEHFTKEEILMSSNSAYLLNELDGETLLSLVEQNPQEHVPVVLKIVKAHFMGFPVGNIILEKISSLLGSLSAKAWQESDESVEHEIASIVRLYANIKQIHSPALNVNLTFFGELNRFVEQWGNDMYRPSYDFRIAMNTLFKSYGVIDWLPIPFGEEQKVQHSFFYILRAYSAVMISPHIIHNLVRIIGVLEEPKRRTINGLKKLISIEQSERDDSLAEESIRVLRKMRTSQVIQEPAPIVSRRHTKELRGFSEDIFTSLENSLHVKKEQFVQALDNALHKKQSELVPNEKNVPAWLQKKLTQITDILSQKGKITCLYSPYEDVQIYRCQDEEEKFYYLAIAWADTIIFEKDENNKIIGSDNIERLCINASHAIRAYQNLDKLKDNRIEIFTGEGKPLALELADDSSEVLNYSVLKTIGNNILRFFTNLSLSQTLIHLQTQGKFMQGEKTISMSRVNGNLNIDFLLAEDHRNPYFTGQKIPSEERLYQRNKWPVHLWAELCFDNGQYQEILIDSIDKTLWQNPKTKQEEIKAVGSKIFIGKIQDHDALFYMKDSRISGGASGNLEGLKYVAATYIAYLKDIPLYVWNDGAGANVREGMISLNRAGQGFNMNALLASRANAKEFYAYTRHNPDETARKLFHELDAQLSLVNKPSAQKPLRCFTVAVGIGSSTGLDVYGSSQTAVQIIFDTPESYRVLTGSNVIKSVTGEDMTNYEIGGAKVMERWTGTVDMVAVSKLQMVVLIKQLQKLFSKRTWHTHIEKTVPSVLPKEITEIDVLNLSVVQANVDNAFFMPFKNEWYGSGNLVGGFAALGGRLTLVMGPRSELGIRSFQAIIRAKELIRSAHKVGANQILVFGKRWYHETILEDALGLRARIDFIKDVQSKNGVRIHIVTHIGGLHKVTLNTLADAIIFVEYPELTPDDRHIATQIAGFFAKSMGEAFAIAHRLIGYLDASAQHDFELSGKTPNIPTDSAQPFDMVQDVIEPAFDKDSFLEFYAPMNNPTTGPSLVTGFARIEGESVAVIADQPVVMGGAPDAPGTEKFRIFTELAERNHLPIVMLSNAPGFVPGAKQERLRIQQIGAESLDVNVLGRSPVVSFVLNQNFGGRQIHSFSKYLRPGIVYIALKNAVMAVMGASASFDLFLGNKYRELLQEGKEKEAGDLRKTYVDDYNQKAAASNDAFQTGILDWLMDDVSELRENIKKGLAEAKRRIQEAFGQE